MFVRLRERKARSAVSPASIAVRAEYSGEATLDHLTVRHAASALNENRYGVFARGSNTRLTLRSVRIVAADGGDGEPATVGATPELPTQSCAIGDGLAAGADGAKGASGTIGSFDAEGFVPGNGQLGLPGAQGHNGVMAVASCKKCVEANSCAFNKAMSCDGVKTSQESCPTAGEPGCGGLPGAGGGGGAGGRASIALFAWQAHVEVFDSLLHSGDGGDGAQGAAGGLGGPARAPGGGAPGISCTICLSAKLKIGPVCSSQADGAAAVRGRVGTKGSAGGPGGDGAGGPSYAIFQGAGATVTQQNTKLEHGAAGKSMGEGAAGTASDQGTSD
ncbi:MAG TPA: hypothetical protein VFN67_19140 [Polyangiales bacterium]|nr:hypothetical protein [Polyangiales bacterium]